jgi:ring-1,2-phenylacetyl-CoA epoxidase subunit PaaC
MTEALDPRSSIPDPGTAPPARDLILVLADSKRLLGTRYAEWILGAPALETGIACASMAQDEWGHARLLYALLKDFDEDVDRLEHGREPEEYASIELLDTSPESWADFVAINALVDTALTVQLQALTESSYAPLRQRVGKLIDEERFHTAHGIAWVRRLATTDEGHAALELAIQRALPAVMTWFGPSGTDNCAGLMSTDADGLRDNFSAAIAPVFQSMHNQSWSAGFGWEDFDSRTRRTRGTAPDADTIARVRGDKNRAFLMD